MLKEALLLCYYPLLALLVFTNSRIEERREVTLGTLAVEALLGFAILEPLTVPILFDLFMVVVHVWR